jgi:beta-N-acetylhexosaminidase
VGRIRDTGLAFEIARVIAQELLSLGINTNFAPVADVLTNPDNPVIGSRAYGRDPEFVGSMVAASVRAYTDIGVLAVLKHFPGHGDTQEDSHYSTAVVHHDLERLRNVEFIPFERGIEAGAQAVMTSHISLPKVLGNDVPATFSSLVMRDLLRTELQFQGLVFTDSMTMGALVGLGPEVAWPIRAFQAGADILVRPRLVEESCQNMVALINSGEVSRDRLKESVRRILTTKFTLGLMELPPPEGEPLFVTPDTFYADEYKLGVPEHRSVADEVWLRSQE